MLEGQVAALSSKALSKNEAIQILKSLRSSAMYREDQNSYMLYPNRELPKFLEKNIIPEDDVKKSSILNQELREYQKRIIEKDDCGCYHFNVCFSSPAEIRKV